MRTFPNYSQLISNGHDTRALVDQAAFLSATCTASIFASDGSGIVRVKVPPSEPGSGEVIEISFRAEKSGDNEGVFNGKYFSEVLDFPGSVEAAIESTTFFSPRKSAPSPRELMTRHDANVCSVVSTNAEQHGGFPFQVSFTIPATLAK